METTDDGIRPPLQSLDCEIFDRLHFVSVLNSVTNQTVSNVPNDPTVRLLTLLHSLQPVVRLNWIP